VTSSKRKHDWNGDRMKLCVFSLNNTEFSFVQLTFIGSLCWSHMTFYGQVVKKSVLWSGDSYKNYSNRKSQEKYFYYFFFLVVSPMPHFFPIMSSGSSSFIFLRIVIFCLILMWLLPFFVFLFFFILS